MTYAYTPPLEPLRPDYVGWYLSTVVPEAAQGDNFAKFLTDPGWAEVRRAATKLEPLLFGLVYFPKHLTDDLVGLSLSPFHVDLAERAKTWAWPSAYRDDRWAVLAPRNAGKSTWTFLILPMWASAHGHRRFVAALADAPTQAEQHLQTFRLELDSNPRLRNDFPELCNAKLRPRGTTYADRGDSLHQQSGFVMMAKGMDSKVLGMKIGDVRPDLIIIDDPEPQESNYSAKQIGTRLSALLDTVLPLNDFAAVAMSGTVTMPGSVMHQLVRPAYGEEGEDWPGDANISCFYYPAIYDGLDGEKHSLWPQRWPIDELMRFQHTREFAKNMMNRPVASDGEYWNPEDIRYGRDERGWGRTVLSIDPAVTKSETSDYYGFSVVSRGADNRRHKVYVRYSDHAKLQPRQLRDRVMRLMATYPEIGLVLIETNQGGTLWGEVLHDLPCRVKQVHQSEPKHVRAARALNDYQRSKVEHTQKHPVLELEQLSYPNVANDDALDSAVTGVLYFMDSDRDRDRPRLGRASQTSYT